MEAGLPGARQRLPAAKIDWAMLPTHHWRHRPDVVHIAPAWAPRKRAARGSAARRKELRGDALGHLQSDRRGRWKRKPGFRGVVVEQAIASRGWIVDLSGTRSLSRAPRRSARGEDLRG
jgi:hypothetical protein